MPKPTTILIVDDESESREILDEYLTKQGFVVHTTHSDRTTREIVSEHHIDMTVLDARLPGEYGLPLTRFLREHYAMGIIMLHEAGEVIDRIVGLEMGADDYLTKPFDLRELLARIKSVLRRLKPSVVSDTKMVIPACKPGSLRALYVESRHPQTLQLRGSRDPHHQYGIRPALPRFPTTPIKC